MGLKVIDINNRKYNNKIYPPGTVFWAMRGKCQNGMIKWYAMPFAVENFDAKRNLYAFTGDMKTTPSSIGRHYFYTREEAISKFLETHDSLELRFPINDSPEEHISEEDSKNVTKYERTDFQDLEICEFDTVDSATVYLGGFNDLRKINKELKWRLDEDAAKALSMPEVKYLTLSEVYEQVKEMYGKDILGKTRVPLITVIIDEPLKGTIYMCSNHEEGIWEKVGETKGYA